MSAAVELSPELDAALRAQLRVGEEVLYARTPRMPRDLHRFGRLGCLDTPTAIPLFGALCALGFTISWVVDEVRGLHGEAAFRGLSGAIFGPWMLLLLLSDVRTSIRERRANRGSIYAVTNQRVLMIATAPKLAVASWSTPDIVAPIRRDIAPDCGHVRFLHGLTSHQGNALMQVPAPEACEAAIRALVSAR